ncbi:MBL fold metallo-hydrolase [Bradyrhizobium sp. RDM4]|uniref:MBL fold metallo-hydrolase n=1 Tax=Bradyrhizobium sp. RDM4 TaxID=3378765 RepID=UPI0038FC05AF
MKTRNSKGAQLKWETFITKRASLSRDTPPGNEDLKWVPNTATLIYGEKDAVLVDTFLTIEASTQLGEWVASKNRKLAVIYITHAHGDHFFGLDVLLQRFPEARVIARPEVVDAMRVHVSPETVDGFWKRLFPGQIADRLMIAEALPNGEFELEGQAMAAIGIGHTDTDNTTCLHVPSIGLVVSGDAAYNGVHPMLGETDAKGRLEWIAALDKIESLKPSAVIAGHKAPGTEDQPQIVEETRKYILEFDRLSRTAADARELYDQMLHLYPTWLNPGSLWTSAKLAKPAA